MTSFKLSTYCKQFLPARSDRKQALIIAAVMLLSGCSAHGESRVAQSSPIADMLRGAHAGQTIELPPGDYGNVVISNMTWTAPVTINARAARFSGIRLAGVTGLSITGGTVVGNGDEKSKGVFVRNSQHITLTDMTISNALVGVTLNTSSDITLRHMTLFNLMSDGVDIAMSRRVVIDQSVCRDFHPQKRVFDDEGALLEDAHHPDCIQGWSRPETAPVSDVTITNNSIMGDMQGISFFNHVKDGVDQGGFDRVTITGNHVLTTRPSGISLYGGRNSVIQNNDVRTIAGSKLARNGNAVRSRIVIVGGSANKICGNHVVNQPGTPEAAPCRD